MSDASFPTGWFRVAAIGMAGSSVVAFAAFMSFSGPVPKTIAYGSNTLFAIYSWAPFTLGVTGLLSVVFAVIALRGSSWRIGVAVVGTTLGIVLFFVVTGLVANAVRAVAPPPIQAQAGMIHSFPLLVFSPPVAGLAGVAIAVPAILTRLRGVSGFRLVIASLVMGGVVTSYWLFNLLILSVGGGD